MRRAVGWAAQVLSPRGSIRVGSQFQMLGFYLAGFLCLVLAALKLTIEGDWSWWRVLLPLWVVLGHNAWQCCKDLMGLAGSRRGTMNGQPWLFKWRQFEGEIIV